MPDRCIYPEKEEYFINQYKNIGYKLLNIRKGGSFGGYKQEIVEHL